MLKFYCRYVDDTLVMIKKDKIQHVLNSFNSFDKNLRFTVDTFDDGNIHFLDIKILNNRESSTWFLTSESHIKENTYNVKNEVDVNTRETKTKYYNYTPSLVYSFFYKLKLKVHI